MVYYTINIRNLISLEISMKIYISVDMEGVSGVSAWEDVNSIQKPMKGTADK